MLLNRHFIELRDHAGFITIIFERYERDFSNFQEIAISYSLEADKLVGKNLFGDNIDQEPRTVSNSDEKTTASMLVDDFFSNRCCWYPFLMQNQNYKEVSFVFTPHKKDGSVKTQFCITSTEIKNFDKIDTYFRALGY